jgi:hypothetical protein
MQISKAFTLMESGPVVLVTTNDGEKNNIMTNFEPNAGGALNDN